jgi:excisionase family DNA binding protein
MLLTQANVADLLQVSRWTVARLIRSGELRVVHVGDRRRIRPEDLDAYLERNHREPGP